MFKLELELTETLNLTLFHHDDLLSPLLSLYRHHHHRHHHHLSLLIIFRLSVINKVTAVV
jgi:hypothetical protein